ncbi:MAG: RHS repeat-associated core domain-containing protein [Armatimonadota bacterium]
MADSRADYTRGGVTGLISEREGSTTRTHHGDQLGSTRGLTDGTQSVTHSREYDAFGMTVGGTGLPTPFGFVGGQGYQKDPDSGLMLLGARYYDPSVGRFISRDPMGCGGGDPNLYRYCANNPVAATDPSGEAAIVIAALVVLAVVFVVTSSGQIDESEGWSKFGESVWNGLNNAIGAVASIGGSGYYDEQRDVFIVEGGWGSYVNSDVMGYGGITLGDVIIVPDLRKLNDVIDHEMIHVEQSRVLGPLYLPAYVGGAIEGWRNGEAHDANPMEIDADIRSGNSENNRWLNP